MSGVLGRILASKREELASTPMPSGPRTREPRDVVETLRRPDGAPLRLIAEIKRRSPSAGPLSTALSPGERAIAYARAGAAMVSVLCDGPFFDGAWSHVAEVRDALADAGLAARVLAKEFVIDPNKQPSLARAWGADALLAIVRIVDAAVLGEIVEACRAEAVEPVVEVASERELETALGAGARVVGVNARDLDTLAMDAARAARVLGAIPKGVVAVHLSGLKSPSDVRAVATTRADAALVGEALMRQDDPSELLAAMVSAASQT